MPIDLNKIREDKGGDPEAVRKSQIARFKDPSLVDQAQAYDQEWRKKSFAVQQKQKELNAIVKAISQKKKENKDDPCEEEMAKSKEINEEIEQLKKIEAEGLALLENKVALLGNIVHESVPVSKDEDDNAVITTWGEPNRMKIDNTPGRLSATEVIS